MYYEEDPHRIAAQNISEPPRNLYDLLRTLIEKVQWTDEGEKREYLDTVNYAQQLRAFGDRLDIRKDRR